MQSTINLMTSSCSRLLTTLSKSYFSSIAEGWRN